MGVDGLRAQIATEVGDYVPGTSLRACADRILGAVGRRFTEEQVEAVSRAMREAENHARSGRSTVREIWKPEAERLRDLVTALSALRQCARKES